MIKNRLNTPPLIYVDYNSTGLLSDEHLSKVFNSLREFDGNPSSQHGPGRRAKVAIEKARSEVATMLGAQAPELIFTSGATESNNLAVQGCVKKFQDEQSKSAVPHLIVGATEHPSILEQVETLAEREVISFSLLSVDTSGSIDRDEMMNLIRPETALVSVMAINNETGAMQDVAELARAVKGLSAGIHFHVDAVQAFGKVNLDWIGKSAIDSVALSGHKLGAFKGCGVLYLKRGTKLSALALGGGQERARRPGTENVPGIISLGIKATEWNAAHRSGEANWLTRAGHCKRRLLKSFESMDGFVLHGDAERDVSNTINFHIDGISGDDLLLNLDLAGIAASSGSACSSGVGRPSHVLRAMGYSQWVALNSVRISFSPEISESDVDQISNVVHQSVARVRSRIVK